jgi:transcriptional regulator with XRE-family HTH domain
VDVARLILAARHGGGLTQQELAQRAGTSQATLSAYERGLKAPSIQVAERIVEAAGYRLDLVTQVHFTEHTAPGVRPFWVPDRLWRGKLPECFAIISMPDPSHSRGVARFDLRRRPSRRRIYEKLLRRGLPDELIDWVDGALLVDLWDELKLPQAIRAAWQPAVDLAGNGPLVHPDYRGPFSTG